MKKLLSLLIFCKAAFASLSIEKIKVEDIKNIDCIVNPANQWLSHGGGLAGALSQLAGPQLQKRSDFIVNKSGIIPVGSVVQTPSYNLMKNNIQVIFHAVGPDCRIKAQKNNRKQLLKKTYKAIFKKCKTEHIASIAIPSISTGIFGFPLDEAMNIAHTVITQESHKNPSLKILLFAHDDITFHAFQNHFSEFLCKKDTTES